MATKIEWTDETWNPVTGCTKVSAGCAHCYAERHAKRLRGRFGYPEDEPFRVTEHEDKWLVPLRWRKPRWVFAVSMGDLFHPDVSSRLRDRVFAVAALAPQHTFQILTKRHQLMELYTTYKHTPRRVTMAVFDLVREQGQDPHEAIPHLYDQYGLATVSIPWPLPNVWLGVSVEHQVAADERVPALLRTPAAVRFVSCEPLLGPVDITGGPWWDWRYQYDYWKAAHPDAGPPIDWVIAGGESGRESGVRPMHPDWARSLRDQCQEAEIPFFFKQWGEWLAVSQWREDLLHGPSNLPETSDRGFNKMYRVGKKRAGRLLDGEEWNERPVVLGPHVAKPADPERPKAELVEGAGHEHHYGDERS